MTMKMKITSILVLISFFSSFAGCATMEEHKGATTGAVVGGAAGAAGGALIAGKGQRVTGAVIGGLLGVLVGGAVGHYAYDTKRTREETAQRYGQQASAGVMVRIEEVTAVPDSVRPGEKVDLTVTYAVLGATPESQISLTEIREIRDGAELVGRPEVSVTHSGGTYVSTVPIYLPSSAKKGVYTVMATVQAQQARDSSETTFRVW